MSTINGLPAHVLLVHFIVVLAPLTGVLAVVCALWPAARRRLVWLVLTLAALCLVLTPITTEAGEWLAHRSDRTSLLHAHAQLGDTMIYFAGALLVAAVLLAFVHVRAERGRAPQRLVGAVIAALVVVVGVGTAVQVYRIGDSGAQAVWGNVAAGN